jgi:beta-glucanase (GH16 family)
MKNRTALFNFGEQVRSQIVFAVALLALLLAGIGQAHAIVTSPLTITQDVLDIDSGGGAVPGTLGVYWAADEYFVGGNTATDGTVTIPAGLVNAAPEAVYRTNRWSPSTYTIPGLTPNGSYLVALHFDENYWSTSGQRVFNVAINGTQVLSNFDIIADAGGPHIADVKTFSVQADATGTITIAFTNNVDNALICGIEIGVNTPPGSPTGPNPPAAPTNLQATAPNAAEVDLSWAASATSAVTYSVFRGTTPAFTPSAANKIASGLTGASYKDTTVAGGTIYYYIVQVVTTDGTNSTINSGTVKVQTPFVGGYITSDVFDVDAGNPTGAAVPGLLGANWVPDGGYVVGGTATTDNNVIIPPGLVNAAPLAVYQTNRYGNSTYTINGFSANTTYIADLHFEENYWSSAGSRIFNVTINGTQVLTNFDIVAAAGANHTANVQSFAVNSDSSGIFTIVFTSVKDNALICGIEIGNGPIGVLPSPPSGLVATPVSQSSIQLSWTASSTSGVTYNVYRGSAAGFSPSLSNQVASGLTATTFTDTGLAPMTTYYYSVQGFSSTSVPSMPITAWATTLAPPCLTLPTVPGTPVASAPMSSEIDLAWGSSTAPAQCNITYSAFRGASAGFTPSAANQVASGLNVPAFSDTTASASTTYYYVIEAVDQEGSSSPLASAEATTPAAGESMWQLVWSDEFTGAAGSAPNPAYWTLDSGLTPDGAQSFNCTTEETGNGCDPSNPNVYLDGDGHLAIVARAASGAPNGVTTGRLLTAAGNNDQTILVGTEYGRIEASINLPTGPGNQGVWPAFWMLGNNISSINWPSCGEIDIMEYIGNANPAQIYSTLHGQGYANEGLGVRGTNASGWSGFHTYGVIWSPNRISFYIDSVTNVIGALSADEILGSGPWVNAGLTAWPFNNPSFLILDLNMGGPFPGNVNSSTIYPQTMLVDYVRIYQSSAPGAPTKVTATANSESQVTLKWTASSSAGATYNVYRSQVSSFAPLAQAQPNHAVLPQTNQTLIADNIAGTSYTDANLSPGQTYYYVVTASGDYSGESAAPQVAVTTPSSGVGTNGGTIYVSAAGYTGAGAYIENTLVSGGFTSASTNTFNTSLIANPAPQDVYHAERWGPQTWTIAHLTPGASYNVRMHLAESTWTGIGQRQFNVLINGQRVLTNLDIYALAGAQNTVVTQTIDAIADSNGVIYLQLEPGAYDQPEIRALDVTPSTGGVSYGVPSGTTTYMALNSGGPAEGSFEADLNGGSFGFAQNPFTTGGGVNTTTVTIGTAGVSNPAPAAAYQTERYGAFGYLFSGLVANANYSIRLHMAEGVADYTAAGDRQFNVVVNGSQVLTNYDIFANAGAVNQAVVATVSGVSDEHGLLSVQFVPGAADLPSIRAIEVTEVVTPSKPSVIVSATTSLSKLSGGYQLLVTLTNSGASLAANLQIATATLGSANGSSLPLNLGTLASGATTTAMIDFPASAGADGASVAEKIAGTYTGGSFSVSLRAVTLP